MPTSAFSITAPFNGLVDTTTNQVVSGTKLFNDPERTGDPIQNVDLVNKGYVDAFDNIGFNAAYSSNTLVLTLTGADGNALSTSNPAKVAFRDSANTGKLNIRTITSPLTLTINSGASLGVETGIKYRLYAGLLDVSGTPELCVWNPYNQIGKSLKRFDEDLLQTSTALAATSVLPQVIYSTSARPTVPFRYIGIAEVTNSTGAWNGTINRNYPLSTGSTKTGDKVGELFSGAGTVYINTSNNFIVSDAKPQITQGTTCMSCAYQAQSECNILNVSAAGQFYMGGSNVDPAMAIFSGNNGNAVAIRVATQTSAWGTTLDVNYKDRANNTNNINWSSRFGPNSNVVNTVYFNGTSSSRLYGGTLASYMKIEEIFA